MNLAAGSVPFADVPLRSVRRSHVEGWVKGMVNRGLAPGTVHTRVNNVRAVLRGAVADKLMASDPSVGVALPRRRRAAAAMTLPTAAQVGVVLQTADDAFRPFVALCAFAGLRLGEAAALQVGDIDFLRRTLTVTRQVQRGGRSRVELRPPKYGSERVVFLAPGLVDLLAAHVAAFCPRVVDGSLPEKRDSPRTRTLSATAGAPPSRPPASRDFDCTTSGTSTPRA
jgi:integrase